MYVERKDSTDIFITVLFLRGHKIYYCVAQNLQFKITYFNFLAF